MTVDFTPDRAKDPDEILDYAADWSDRLGTDTIVGSSWSITRGTGLQIESNSYTTKTVTIWLSGGTNGVTYTLLNTVTTAAGRTMQESFYLRVKDQL